MNRPQLKYKTCEYCHGKGERPGPTTGLVMRRERQARGVTQKAIAEFFFKPDGSGLYSPSYLEDLERDSRAWSNPMIESYRKGIELAVRARLERNNES